jgi:hypothetical protein
MTNLLDFYSGPAARRALLGRYPDLLGLLDVAAALINAHDAGELSAADRARAARIGLALRQVVGHLQEVDGANLDVAELIALARVKKLARDTHLLFTWPFAQTGSGRAVVLDMRASAALERLVSYDPLHERDTAGRPLYSGGAIGILADLRDLVAGFAMRSNR